MAVDKSKEAHKEVKMKTYNTICGIICILLLLAALIFAAYKDEKSAPTPEVSPVAKADEPQPTPEPYIRYKMTDYERDIVERVVMAESGNQPLEGQMAVAQCILNTAEAEGMRPDAVVLAPNQYAKPAKPESVTTSIKTAVSAVFDHGSKVTDEPIRFFYAPKYSAGRWHESALQHVITIGDHKFFKIPN